LRISNVLIASTSINILEQLSAQCFPEESCAILFGSIQGEKLLEIQVTKIVELHNIVHSPVEFRWDEMEFYQHYLTQKKAGLSFVGVFHSHPNEPYISRYDKIIISNTGKLYPELVWIVYGNKTHTFKAFVLARSRQIIEIPIIKRHN
jgi:[CysO sulfur-carrier protein]-S-L-cysteine hydrolase